ncbi:MAG: phosphoribosylglycinamide formyltransferase [Limnochordia bacterium]|jgi:phosphoribosylglycinamide formyltransferase-1|nr:phosphoribosylglycinamide formyltransferase [Limnochordia bacterium]MDI9465501.1 phosphoribosylglycinamide formyltransferase [Bacillota bacterium]HOB41307.1 phosphoribosylglycinamide formyltransferase [Limnochordia bacterium]HOK32054.1 phosphoribosylglycinamide formyltransferase [Limnochordia bacterium]HOQ74410.1 phosphoribosylglycinamide formyltransferase [Limnochordia bacterium]
MTNISVFASGNGSNLQAIIDAIQRGELEAKIQLVVCDNPEAYCLERAARAGLSRFLFYPHKYPSKAVYEELILRQLRQWDVEYLVLAGYMRIIGPTLLEAFPQRIINIHPSLLPAFPGRDAIGQALAAGVPLTGVTIHYVDEGIDTGPIIAQRPVPIDPGETRESLERKIHAVEHELYPKVLQEIFTKRREILDQTSTDQRF